MIVIKLWQENRRWHWVVQETTNTAKGKPTVIATGSEADFGSAAGAAKGVYDAAVAGADAARAMFGRGRR